MAQDFVICDQDLLEASLVPPEWLGVPGGCPAGIYETLRVSNGVVQGWQDHWERLVESVGSAGLGMGQTGLRARVERLCAEGCEPEVGRLRIMVFTKPEALLNGKEVRMVAFAGGTAVAAVGEFRCDVSIKRRRVGDLEFTCKRLGRGDVDAELEQGRSAGYDDVIFCNEAGELCEAGYANIGVIIGGEIVTPLVESPCLPGLTMARVGEWALAEGIGFSRRAIHLRDFVEADEVFLTSSVRGVQRVTSVKDYFTRSSADAGIVERLAVKINL